MESGGVLQGVITERHFALAEVEFPGIERFYRESPVKPRTFLELVWRFTATFCRSQAGASQRLTG
jgi:hypothetical protein